ncbi:MAG: 1-deoxy-D-xylulose-5-phosphate synthase [Tannerellaceae bacterium]|jgi:1-deoxy-D-xylulose-5-phosphate synthase|nr:1-deoxy-D-xylulose-5-phosphate synthase [Tannerellaceae bacterium]
MKKKAKGKSINTPEELRELKVTELEGVCADLRQYIIDILSERPGHLAASLGTVELTVALHYVFNTPYDRIVWDVGHQAYSHKILTGRREAFRTLRSFGGISGFPNPAESEYDTFIAGHASNSISAALGLDVASQLNGEARKTIAVIGDGAMTGGLAYEGLNNAASTPNNLLVILNDNDMSIEPSVGGLSRYLTDITISRFYNNLRYDIFCLLRKAGLLSENSRRVILHFNNSLKALLLGRRNLFEGFGIRCFGPVDGHDVRHLVRVLNAIKGFGGPTLLHVKTVKGKGFAPAEHNAVAWHAPGRFNKRAGERTHTISSSDVPLYQDVFGHTLVELAENNPRIVGITPAMPTGSSLCYLMRAYPERTFDVGIAEGHALTFAAGLARGGMIPVCVIYSSFVQRAFDMLIHDVALQQLHVVLCLDRAGLVGEDGATHHGVFDLACFRPIPNLTIASPMDEYELRHLMYTACQVAQSPFIIRYPRGQGTRTDWQNVPEATPIGKGRVLRKGEKLAVLSIGPIGNTVCRSLDVLEKEGVLPAHFDMRYLKPLDEDILREAAQTFDVILTVEDGAIQGGLGGAVAEYLTAHQYRGKLARIGIPDTFIQHGSVEELYAMLHMDVDGIAGTVRKIFFEEDDVDTK